VDLGDVRHFFSDGSLQPELAMFRSCQAAGAVDGFSAGWVCCMVCVT